MLFFHSSVFVTPENLKSLKALKRYLKKYLAILHNFPLNNLYYIFVGEDPQSSEESKTIVLSAASRPGSRGRKIPLKLLKVKKQSQPQVSYFWSITHTFNFIVMLVKYIKKVTSVRATCLPWPPNQLLTDLFSPQTSMTSLVKIRHQILRLLGSLGGQTNMLVLGNTDPSKAVTWDTNNHLTFAVPFQDMKPNIYLGKVTTLRVLLFRR